MHRRRGAHRRVLGQDPCQPLFELFKLREDFVLAAVEFLKQASRGREIIHAGSFNERVRGYMLRNSRTA